MLISQAAFAFHPPQSRFGLRQRLTSATLMLGIGSSVGAGAAMANGGLFVPVASTGFAPHHAASASAASTWQSASHSTTANNLTFAVSNVLHAVPNAAAALKTPAQNHNAWSAGFTSTFATAQTSQNSRDLNLTNAQALFAANTLAGFHTLTINVGGKQQVVRVNDHLTAAELVAAEQVLAGGKQQLTINAEGIASGGSFDLDKTTVGALDTALGGNIGSLTIGRGVEVIDSLATLNLSGSLNNAGSIVVGAAPSAHGQSVDTIHASSIYNAAGSSIQSGSILGTLVPTDIVLDASSTFLNNGLIHSSGNLTISGASVSNLAASAAKPAISAVGNISLVSSLVNNTGTVASTTGNVTVGGSNIGNLTVLNSNGVLQAQKGTVQFAVNGGSNSDTITVTGGNILSKVADFAAGKGALQVNVGQLTGELEGEACSAHVSAETKTLSLGKLDVTGDPTYYNTGGDILIDTGFSGTNGADLAIVASGNIIGNGGKLDTSSQVATGGNLTLIAGANFTVAPAAGNGVQGPDTTSTLTVTNSTAGDKGSKTGGYIDLSGMVLTGSKTATPVTSITTDSANLAAGNVLMVAYKGSGKNSGSVVDTALASQAGGAGTIDTSGRTGDGSVTIIAPGSISGQNINGNFVQLLNSTPVIGTGQASDALTILNGSITGGAYSLTATPVIGSVTQSTITASSIVVATAGRLSAVRLDAGDVDLIVGSAGSVATPVKLSDTAATTVTVNNPAAKGAGNVYLSTDNSDVSLGQSTLGSSSTLSVQSGGALQLNGPVSAGTVLLGAGGTGALNAEAGITSPNVTLSSGTGTITAEVATANFAINTSGSNVAVTLQTTAAKTTNILASSIAGANNVITANQPLKITGQIDVSAEGSLTVDYVPDSAPSKLAPGITLAAPINTSASLTGNITFENDNTKTASFVTGSGATINAANINVNWAGPIGTGSAPVVGNTASLFSAQSQSPIFLKDVGAGAVDASSAAAVTITGVGSLINIHSITAPLVTITNPASKTASGGINLVDGAAISDAGATNSSITISAAGNITADPTALINGTQITLSSTTGNIGTPATMTTPAAAIMMTSGSGGTDNTVSLNAPKGSILIGDTANATLSKATALNDFEFDATGSLQTSTIAANTIVLFTNTGNLTVAGSLGGTKTFDIDLNSGLNISTGGKGTIFRADNVELTAASNIGQSVAIKTQTPTLSISAVNGVANVTNNGDVKLVFITAQDINVTSTGTISTTDTTWTIGDSASLTAPKAIIFNTGNTITANALSLSTPAVTVNTGASITATSATTIASTGSLVISGGGQLMGGSSVQLSGTNVSLGSTAKGGNSQSPLILDGTGNTANLAVTTNGNFSLDFNKQIYLANNGTQTFVTANITAANIVNTNAAATGPLKITTIDSTGTVNQQNIILSGSNAVTLGDGVGQIQASAIGTAAAGVDGQVTFSTNGALTLANNPYTTSQGGAFIVLQGKSIALTNDLTDPKVGQLFLKASGSLLDVTKNIAVSTSGVVSLLGSKGVTVENGVSVSANSYHIFGATVTNNGTINGTGTQPVLSIAGSEESKSAPLTISNTQTGSFIGFYGADIEASGNGALKTGNLFTSAALLKDTLTSLQLGGFGTGVITLSPLVQDLGVVANGALNITGKSVSYSSMTSPALALKADGGNLTVNLNAPITVGKAKGNFDITGTQFNLVLSALGNLTINEPVAATGGATMANPNGSFLDATGQVIVNAATNFHATDGSALVTVSTDGTAKTSTVINTATSAITGDHVTLQRTSTIMPTTPTFTNAGTIFLQLGALNVSNGFSGETHILSTGTTAAPLTSLNFVNDSGSSTGQLTVEPITTSSGNMTITEKSGNIVLAGLVGGSQAFNATDGNIVINDLNATGAITLFSGVQLVASSTKADLGNVTIAVGSIPTTPIVGTAPANPPLQNETLGGQIFWGGGTPLNFVGTNTVSALGRNVIFSSGTGTINVGSTLDGNTGGVLVQADPPSGASVSVLHDTLITAASVQASPALENATISSVNQMPSGSSTRVSADRILPFCNQAVYSLNASLTEPVEEASRAILQNNNIFRGASLFAPVKDLLIETSSGTISIAGGSVVLLLAFDGGVAVYNLHDNKAGAVAVTRGTVKITVAPGHSTLLTDKHVRFFEEINPVQTAAYRNIRSNRLDGGLTSFEADFSHTSLLSGVSGLREFATSSDKHARRVSASVLKTAAILGQSSRSGQYQYMVAPAVTASNF